MIFRRLFGGRNAGEGEDEPAQAISFGSPEEGDALILDQLRSMGADLSQPREVVHYLYLPSESAAHEVGRHLGAEGLKVEVRKSAGLDGPLAWLVLARRDEIMSLEAARGSREHLSEVADANGGEYDGWEAAAIP